jgi:two-component system, OmpR family, phosphate regulon sensor histidine kinase PhoR
MPLWFSVTLKFSTIVLVGMAAGAWQGAIAGWAAACIGLLLLHVAHVHQLTRLERWLKSPATGDARKVPDAWGAWGLVFAGIYRALRREAQKHEAVSHELDLFMRALQALPHGIVLIDSGDQLLWCNESAALQLGLKTGTDYGMRITNVVRVPGLAAFLQRARAGGTLDYRPAHLPGQLLSLEALPFDALGDGRKLLVSFDITQVALAETTRRDFIANVSHELRTPLTVIHGFLEHMHTAPAAPVEQTRRHIELMTQQSHRMLKLVDDLLMLSRLEAGDNPPREESLAMSRFIEEIASEARALSAGRHVIDVQAPAQAGVKGGTDELRSAFGNLVSNAVRYTPDGGRITLSWCGDEQGRGVFGVADTGIGIAAEHIPRLTERFYRVDRGRSRDTGGTGLGLAIVKHVLLRHQAVLEIKSELGAGSEFRIVFPAWRSVVEPSCLTGSPETRAS